MHGTMEKTHEGMHHGTVKVPKNAARVKEFVDLDKQFHARLESLSAAAHRNDQQAMLKLTKDLLDGCVQCHRTFRN
jgi:cytochrome c556